MPRRRRPAQNPSKGVQAIEAAEQAVLDLAAVFPPQQIAAGLGRLWVLDGQELAPALDVAGRAWECPITLDSIASPVMLGDGHVYEEEAILHWLQGNAASPCTNLPLEHKRALKLAPVRQTLEHFLLQGTASRTCPIDRIRRAMREAEASAADPCDALVRLEGHLADFRFHVSELQAELERANAVAARLRAAIHARKERCATLVQAAFRSFQARGAAARLRRQAQVRMARRPRAARIIQGAWQDMRRARCAARLRAYLARLSTAALRQQAGSEAAAGLGDVVLFDLNGGAGPSRLRLGVLCDTSRGNGLQVSYETYSHGPWMRVSIHRRHVLGRFTEAGAFTAGPSCLHCGARRPPVRLATWASCESFRYCCPDCQRQAWRAHHGVCGVPRLELPSDVLRAPREPLEELARQFGAALPLHV